MWMDVNSVSDVDTSTSDQNYAIPHDEQFLLRDSASGEPLANIQYRIKTASGRVIDGMTDGNGRTQRIRTDSAEQLVFHLLHGSQA